MSLLIRCKRLLVLLLIVVLLIVIFTPYSPVKLFVLYDIKHYALQMNSESENIYNVNGPGHGNKIINRDDIFFIYNILRTGRFQFHPILTETPPDWSPFSFEIGDIFFSYSMKTFRQNLVVDYHGFDYVIYLKEDEVNKLFTFFKVKK
jgi:hypothetical protein